MKKKPIFYISFFVFVVFVLKIYGLTLLNVNSNINEKVIIIPVKEYLIYDKSNTNKIDFDSTKKIKILLSNKNYIEEATIFYKQYSMVVKSYYIKDSVDRRETNLFNPICIKQTIYFYREHKLIKTFDSSAKTIIQRISGGKKIKMLENVIVSIGLIKTKNGIIAAIEGSGGPECESCSYFDGIYDLNGTILAADYASKYKSYFKYGSIYSLIKNWGINKTEFEQMHYSHIKIYNYQWWLG